MIVRDSRTATNYDDETGQIYTSNGQATSQYLPGYTPAAKQIPQLSQTPSIPAQAQAQPQSRNDVLYFGDNPKESQKAFMNIFGTNPQDYAGTFQNAYEQNNQPTGGHEDVIANGTYVLANAYIDGVLKKTGKLPDEQEVRSFVANNLNTSFADKIIRGAINNDQIMAQYVEPAIAQRSLSNGNGNANDDINKGILGLNDLNTQLYNAAKAQTTRDVEDAYVPQKQNVVEDLAAQNRLGQANSRYSLDALEAAKNKSLASALGNVSVNQAQSGLDIGKTAQQLLANQRALGQQANQFGLTYGLQNKALNASLDQSDYERNLQRQQLGLASQLGREQAEANKPGWTDYLNTSLKGLNSLGSAFNNFTKA